MLDRYGPGRLLAAARRLSPVVLAAMLTAALAAAQDATGPTPAPTDIRKPHDTVGSCAVGDRLAGAGEAGLPRD